MTIEVVGFVVVVVGFLVVVVGFLVVVVGFFVVTGREIGLLTTGFTSMSSNSSSKELGGSSKGL